MSTRSKKLIQLAIESAKTNKESSISFNNQPLEENIDIDNCPIIFADALVSSTYAVR